MKGGHQNKIDTELEYLKYLQEISDYENGIDRGTIAGKEVLIYSYGKTGTVSLYHAVGRYMMTKNGWSGYQDQLLHNHNNRSLVGNIKATVHAPSRDELLKRPIIKDLLRYKELTGQRALIISSYREPLSRAISSVFQQLDRRLNTIADLNIDDINLDDCRKQLMSMLNSYIKGQPHPIEEFDRSFFEKEAFDKKARCCHVDRGYYEILVVNIEQAQAWKAAFEQKLNFHGIEFNVHNTASEKNISSLYSDFKDSLRIPIELINMLYYNSAEQKYLQWFYTDDEIQKYRDQLISKYGER